MMQNEVVYHISIIRFIWTKNVVRKSEFCIIIYNYVIFKAQYEISVYIPRLQLELKTNSSPSTYLYMQIRVCCPYRCCYLVLEVRPMSNVVNVYINNGNAQRYFVQEYFELFNLCVLAHCSIVYYVPLNKYY